MAFFIGEPSTAHDGDWVVWSVPVGDGSVWFKTRAEFAALLSETVDAALVALIYPAMLAGEDIVVEGEVSELLHYNVGGPLQALLRVLNPALRPVSVVARRTVRKPQAKGCATGFSGGIDSFSAIRRHFLHRPVSRPVLTHLTIHDIWNAENFATFDLASPSVHQGYKQLLPVAERWGLPFIPVTSNVGSFYRGVRFEDTHTLRNAAVAHLLGAGIGRFIYASTFPFGDQQYRRVSDIARADVAVLSLVSGDAVIAISGDPDVSRLQKTALLTTVPETHTHLHVCASTWQRNCSVCWKCRRTMLTLEVLGAIDDYRAVFDVDQFRHDKAEYLAGVLNKGDVFIDEIVAYAESHNIELTPPQPAN